MGGYGSGRWYRFSSKETADSCKGIDVNYLRRQGYLQPGRSWGLYWSRGGQPCGDIRGLALDAGQIVLLYRWRERGGEWEEVRQPVRLTHTACNYGGGRPWFVCPGLVNGIPCQRRVGKLYAAGKYFLCRHCYGLVYQSQREEESERLMTKAQLIRKRLGGSGSLLDPLPWQKPKGMHWQTFDRLRLEAKRVETAHWLRVSERFGLLDK